MKDGIYNQEVLIPGRLLKKPGSFVIKVGLMNHVSEDGWKEEEAGG